MPKKALFFW